MLRLALMDAGRQVRASAGDLERFPAARDNLVRLCFTEPLPHLETDEGWQFEARHCAQGRLLADAIRTAARAMTAAVYELVDTTSPCEAVAETRVLHALLAAHAHGDVRPTLQALLPLVAEKNSDRFLRRMLKKHDRLMNKAVGAYTRKVDKLVPIHPEYAASILDDVAAVDAIFTADTGMCNVWTARYIRPLGTRRLIGSYLHGSMANALPQAIGAQLTFPDRQVVSVSGDGGLSMLLGELITAATLHIPVKVVLFNNSTLGMVKLEMLVDGLPDFGVDVPDTNYAAIAEAIGYHARRVVDPADLEDAYRAAFAHDGPALVEVITDAQALSLPPKITGEQIFGFTTAMSKVVLNKGAGEAVSMARSNLRNLPRG